MAANNKGNNPRGLKNVLIARFSAIGDVAISIPVVYSVCRCYPDVNFIMVTRPAMTSIFVNPPQNLTMLGIDVKNDYNGVKGMSRLLKELRRDYNIDAFVDLHEVLRTHVLRLLCRLHGIPTTRIHKGRGHKRALTRRHNKVMLPLISSSARYRAAFYQMGLPLQERFNGLFDGGKGDISPLAEVTGPKHKGKIYPPELMEKVVAEFATHPDTKIFLFGGGEEERKILADWAVKYPTATSLAEKKYGFGKELALLSHLDVMVSMDSANMHLAALVGVPVVSIWGATHPYCGFKGWRQSEDNAIQLSMTCRPCSVFGNKPCYRGDYHCLAGIPPQVIIDKVNRLITK